MLYCRRLKSGENCVINAPANTPREIIDFLFEKAESVNSKMRKMQNFKKVIFAIFGFCAAAAFTIFAVNKKIKKAKA